MCTYTHNTYVLLRRQMAFRIEDCHCSRTDESLYYAHVSQTLEHVHTHVHACTIIVKHAFSCTHGMDTLNVHVDRP